MYVINKLYNCGIFQGADKNKHYFEGWYFKHVDKSEQNIISIIPGISIADDQTKSHAFIQIIDGSTHKTYYVKYKIGDFSFSKENFQIKIADNIFTDKGIKLNIDAADVRLKGKLYYSRQVHWPSSIASPNSMGWYAYIPIMECYHGVLSLQHDITGQLELNDSMIGFDAGKGYIEKDWGTSFPSSWIWLQSNHFDIEDTSFMLSIAKIPWHSKSFTGFIIGLWNNKKIYRFATYTGAKLDSLEYHNNSVELSLSDKDYRLIVKAHQGNTGELQAPVKGAMVGKVKESINGKLDILLIDKKTDTTILNTNARCCGMEVAGNIQELVSLP
jgi:tocopherol cyclase